MVYWPDYSKPLNKPTTIKRPIVIVVTQDQILAIFQQDIPLTPIGSNHGFLGGWMVKKRDRV